MAETELVIELIAKTEQALAQLSNVDKKLSTLEGQMHKTQSATTKMGSMMEGAFMGAGMAVANLALEFGKSLINEVIATDKAMRDLSALTGITGDSLHGLEKRAKALAVEFGTSVVENITSMKLVISALGPDVAKDEQAITDMTRSLNTLALAAGVDAVVATEALTITLAQFGFNTGTAAEQALSMQRIMNVMAAGAKEGAAEVGDLSAAMRQVGATASGAKVTVEQTVAALEVLSQSGIKGAEGGVAFRNMLLILQKGEDIPRKAMRNLEELGISMESINPEKVGLSTALKNMHPVLNDNATLISIFGKENSNTARAMIENADAIDTMTEKVTGTNTAVEQAAEQMKSLDARLNKIMQNIKSIAIPVVEALVTVVDEFVSVLSSDGLIGVLEVLLDPLKLAEDGIRSLGKSIGGIGEDIGNVIADVTSYASYINPITRIGEGVQWVAEQFSDTKEESQKASVAIQNMSMRDISPLIRQIDDLVTGYRAFNTEIQKGRGMQGASNKTTLDDMEEQLKKLKAKEGGFVRSAITGGLIDDKEKEDYKMWEKEVNRVQRLIDKAKGTKGKRGGAQKSEVVEVLTPTGKEQVEFRKWKEEMAGYGTTLGIVQRDIETFRADIKPIEAGDIISVDLRTDMEKFVDGLAETLTIQLPSIFTDMGSAMNSGADALKSVLKKILNMLIDTVEGIILSAAAAMTGKAITTFGFSLTADAPLLAAAYAGLEIARGFVNSFAGGGVNTTPGLAMLHGTKRNPEFIFNTDQMKTLLASTAPLRGKNNSTRVIVSGEFVQRGKDLYSVVRQRDEHIQRSII